MTQQLPPPALVETWLKVLHCKNIPNDIVLKRSYTLCFYFGSIDLAYEYVEQNGHTQKKAS